MFIFQKKLKIRRRVRVFRKLEGKLPTGLRDYIRTASEHVTVEQLRDEAKALLKMWETACLRARGMAKPGILLEPEPLTARLMRDMARNLERVVVNDLANYKTLCRIQQEGRLSKETRVDMPTSGRRCCLMRLS